MWNYIYCIYLCALVNKIKLSYIIVINTALLKMDIFLYLFLSKSKYFILDKNIYSKHHK